MPQENKKELMLEERKVKALEKIANVLDALTLWFEDIDKEEWSNRTQWYLAVYHKKYIEEDKEKYPVPGKKGEYYSFRMDMDTLKNFEEGDYMEALEYIGIFENQE